MKYFLLAFTICLGATVAFAEPLKGWLMGIGGISYLERPEFDFKKRDDTCTVVATLMKYKADTENGREMTKTLSKVRKEMDDLQTELKLRYVISYPDTHISILISKENFKKLDKVIKADPTIHIYQIDQE